MKPLLLTALALATLFASTFVIATSTGFLNLEMIEANLQKASRAHGVWVALTIIALMVADIVIAVPTLALSILAGYFLGFVPGALTAITGLMLAGLTGYSVCRRYGEWLLRKIYRDPAQVRQMRGLFNQHGPAVLLMCRALPILPEVSCCLAGANRMPLTRFATCFMASTVPYAGIAAFAGSRSSLDNPQPAIIAAIALALFFWGAWAVFMRQQRLAANTGGGP